MNWKNLLLFTAMFAAAFFLWDTVAIYPIKVIVVFFHEISHGLAAILTGGSIGAIRVDPNLGGVTMTWGGSSFLISSAGYLGSMVWGCAILIAASRMKSARPLMGALGLFLLAMTLLYVRNLFGFVFGGLVGAAMLFMASKASDSLNDFVLKFLGFTSCLYVVLDIKEDLLMAHPQSAQSDAFALQQMTGIPALFWGGLWFLLALVALGFSIYAASKVERRAYEVKKSPAL
jgi:hypothetical protein